MVLRKCPVCGGKLRSEALGWICYDCQGFIDMQGVFHEHTEKPFMPPMTNADSIRAMTDEELAEWMARTQITVIKDVMTLLRIPYDEPDRLVEKGKTEALQWLKQPAE